MNYFKPGGGNKPQPYIPAGHGDKSGEYTNKPITNRQGLYNIAGSSLVKQVDNIYSHEGKQDIPILHKPNTVLKILVNNTVVSERFYGKDGIVYLDIDYTNHGNPATHPVVPHIHIWTYNKEKRKIERSKWRNFR